MSERWLPIAGYEGLYEVSDLGRVRSLDRINPYGRRVRGRTLLQEVTHAGYCRVALSRAGKLQRIFVHRLVLVAFVEPRPAGMEACHNDGDPTNNVPSNLRWDTHHANMRDRHLHGRDATGRITHCPQGHEYNATNTYVRKEGHRSCRICPLDRQKARRARARKEAA